MRAVSIKLGNGKTVTLMPFDSVEVKRGTRVGEGQCLGTLAPAGDVSSTGAHLHMGLKEGRTYYDPMTLFGLSSVASAALPQKSPETDKGSESPKGQADSVAEEAGATAGQPENAASPESAPAASAQRGSEAVHQGAREASPSPDAEWEPGVVSSGEVVWEPRAQEGGSPAATIGSALEPAVRACSNQAAALVDGLRSLSNVSGVPQWAVYLGAFALALAAVVASVWAFARWVAPFVGSLWSAIGKAWSGRKKSGKVLGLFPAPGSAFIARGR